MHIEAKLRELGLELPEVKKTSRTLCIYQTGWKSRLRIRTNT